MLSRRPRRQLLVASSLLSAGCSCLLSVDFLFLPVKQLPTMCLPLEGLPFLPPPETGMEVHSCPTVLFCLSYFSLAHLPSPTALLGPADPPPPLGKAASASTVLGTTPLFNEVYGLSCPMPSSRHQHLEALHIHRGRIQIPRSCSLLSHLT